MSIVSEHSLVAKRAATGSLADGQKPCEVYRHQYGYKILAAMLLVILLSILDALLTLFLTSQGASEINPVMAYFLDRSPLAFFLAKYLLTCFGLVIILLNKNSYLFGTKVQAKILFVLFVIPFALVIKWELYLILFVL